MKKYYCDSCKKEIKGKQIYNFILPIGNNKRIQFHISMTFPAEYWNTFRTSEGPANEWCKDITPIYICRHCLIDLITDSPYDEEDFITE